MTVPAGLAVRQAARTRNKVAGQMQNPFEWSIGQRVVVQLAFGEVKVSLRGMLLRDQAETLLMRLEVGPDIEIAKTRVLAIEELGRRHRSFPWRAFEMPLSRCADGDLRPHPNKNLMRYMGRIQSPIPILVVSSKSENPREASLMTPGNLKN